MTPDRAGAGPRIGGGRRTVIGRPVRPVSVLAVARDRDYITVMDNPLPGDNAPLPETDADRKRRIAWEAARIAEADASVAAGRLIDAAEIDAWIDSIGSNHELPPPRSGR
jgi:predicted transcriptional regulator